MEKELENALSGSKHFIVFGESGSGKSWLYKRVFRDRNVKFEVVNLANAVRFKSLDAAFQRKYEGLVPKQDIETTKTTKGGLAPGGVGASYEQSTKTVNNKKEPFEALMSIMRGTKRRKSVLVLDNFEQILGNQDIVDEVSNCIVLLDDEDYSDYNVKICIVGVPAEIRDYLAAQQHMATVSNRIDEVSEVERMTEGQARSLLHLGLSRLLALEFDCDEEQVYQNIAFACDRIAAELQELGLAVARLAVENDGVIEDGIVEDAIYDWSIKSFNAARIAVESRLNSRETHLGRRNQCIYALGICETQEFRYSDIEKIVRREFPDSTLGVTLDIAGTLAKLAKGDNAPIRKVANGDAYRFSKPQYRMAIRTLLAKDSDGKIKKIQKRL